MLRTHILFIGIATCLLVCRAQAQIVSDQLGGPSHVHASATDGIVDGAANPELVPDSVAYRLYFIAVSEKPNPTPEEATRQLAHIRRIGLEDTDQNALIDVLTEFKTRYDEMVTQFNAIAEADTAAGTRPDIATFLRNRDKLIQDVREALARALSQEGVAKLNNHVQAEKKNMKVSIGEAQ
jgi:hypothetical protein